MVPPSRPKSRSSLPVYPPPHCSVALAGRRLHHVTPISLPFSAGSAYFPSSRKCTFHRHGVQAFGTCKFANSFVYRSLVPLCRLFALFSAFGSFVFNRLRPLFPKHPGVGTRVPTSTLKLPVPAAPTRRCSVSPLLVPSYFAGLNPFCIPSPIVPVPPPSYTRPSLQEAPL